MRVESDCFVKGMALLVFQVMGGLKQIFLFFFQVSKKSGRTNFFCPKNALIDFSYQNLSYFFEEQSKQRASLPFTQRDHLLREFFSNKLN